ncbi:30S ribosomal protein S6 [Patescibacteria group bacterium]|nr:30S ribosomal protein S6 [Patescibacteria group bacterium]MBU1075415.1 30S ribosomal protein S6 [Patescibacteria group bacterium]MBU1951649.1 30S ribosomal protein S6 [Patescibacteria group bacterium]
MQNYELLVIISSKITEEEIPSVTDKIFELIKKNEGTIVRDENMGKKKLSYPIQHQRYGFYVLVDFDLPGESLRKVEKELKLMEEVTRYMVVVRDVLAAARAAKRAEEEKERRLTPPLIEKKPVLEPETPAKPRSSFADSKPDAKEKPAVPEKKKVSLEELDEKLDQILDDDIMRT